MIEKTPLDDGSCVEVAFVVPVEWVAGPVSVAGDFNDWDIAATPLQPDGDSLVTSVVLPAGSRYAFRYFSDGSWFNDDAADGYEPNEFGSHNCVVDLHSG